MPNSSLLIRYRLKQRNWFAHWSLANPQKFPTIVRLNEFSELYYNRKGIQQLGDLSAYFQDPYQNRPLT